MSTYAIETYQLIKRFGHLPAVDHVEPTVRAGGIHSFLIVTAWIFGREFCAAKKLLAGIAGLYMTFNWWRTADQTR